MMGITVKEASEMSGMTPNFIRYGLQQGVLPFGVAVKMRSSYSYYISKEALEKFMREGKQYECKN